MMADLENSDIQGFVLSSYANNMPCAKYIFLKIIDASLCRDWLISIIPNITTGVQRKDDYNLNIAFTASGLRILGFSDQEMQTFSRPFQDGICSPTRQQILGDNGKNDPENWAWGNPKNPVDILLMLFAKDEQELNLRLSAINKVVDGTTCLTRVAQLSADRQPDTREHFGFVDGVGQPVIEGTGKEEKQFARTGHATVIKAGEFILGYENEMQKTDPLPASNAAPEFGRNGTYLVFRQLEQHVDAFWNYLKDTTSGPDSQSSLKDQEMLAAKMIGRWRSGAPVTSYRKEDPAAPNEVNAENNFNFAASDIDGFGCPIGAHIRRTNPRDSLFDDPEMSMSTVKRHRLLRRGRSYGDRTENVYQNDGKERGLHFIGLNSNIERQFEFIQQSWMNNEHFSALDHETDPLIGHRNDRNMFSIQGCPVRTRIHNVPDFVNVKGGAYLFMPGIKGLEELCKM